MRALMFFLLGCAGSTAVADPPELQTPVWLQGPGLQMETDPFAWDGQASPVVVGEEGTISLRLVVPESHFVYQDAVSIDVVEASGLRIGAPSLPPGEVKPDPAGDPIERAQYARDTWIEVPVTADADVVGLQTVVLDIRHQGCRPGLCFPPRTTRLELLVPVRAPE